MIIEQGITEKNGKICFIEREIYTGICHYYPIKARVEIKFTPNMPIFMKDPYLYVDREKEL
jgi:hypothetical protein